MSGRHASPVTEPVRIVDVDDVDDAPFDDADAVDPGSTAAGITVLSGMPDVDEVAAITAVLSGVLDELAAEQGRRELAGPGAWARSQRALRSPLTPGPGQWRGFSA